MKTGYCLMTMCCLLAALSCTRQEIEPAPENQDALTLRITKADGTGVLVENLYVLIYDQDPAEGQEPVFYYESPADQTVDLSGITLIDGIWRSHFDGHDVCDVYVIANWNGDGTQQSPVLGKMTLEQLKDVLEYNSALISDAAEGKFTMTGVQEGWKPAESPDVHTLLVPLERVAARIEVALYAQAAAGGNWEESDIIRKGSQLSFDGADAGETETVISAPQFRLINYATRSWLMDGRDAELDDRGLTSIADDAVVEADGEPFISYSYPNDWTSDLLDETYVLVNVPVEEGEGNYYKIPLRALSEPQDLKRNHHYTVRAVISARGNATPDEPQLLENISYKVAPWEDVDMDVDPGNPVYLELSEYDVTITTSEAESSQEGSSTHGLIFASSSPISEVTVSEVYFYNQYGDLYDENSEDYYDVDIAYSEIALNGPMTITSRDPLNKTVLYFTLTVKNEQGEERTVTVRHYPLEYITGVAGAYSYLDNREDYTGEWRSSWSRLEYDNTKSQDVDRDEEYEINVGVPDYIQNGLDGHIGNKVDMKSKFYIKNEGGVGRIFRIDEGYEDQDKLGYESSDGLAYKVADNKSTGSNNMMYHVVVTSTSEDYVLARPIMSGEVVDPDRRDNDSFVSPSFMLASQLGNSSTVTWSTAQEQCRDYVEVAVDENDRETVYDDWRLPTAAEIGILIRYQSDDRVNTGGEDGVMSHILNYKEAPETDRSSNPYYWVSSSNTYVEVHERFDSNNHVKTATNSNDEYRVRCVRDVYVSDNNQN